MGVRLEDFDRTRDRRDPERAARLFELLWPDQAVRVACAERLAASIRRAHKQANASWEVTMFSDRVRLNVGQVEVLTLYSDKILVLFSAPLNMHTDRRFSVDFDPAHPVYLAVPVSSGACRFTPVDLKAVPQTLWKAHKVFIDAAAEAKRVSPFKKSFSDGVLRHIEKLLRSPQPRPSYFAIPDENRVADDWRRHVRSWVRKGGDAAAHLADSVVRFFERAFESARCRDQAWFGVHRTAVSLVVGGIFLAAVLRTGRDRGFWLLVDQQPPPVEGVEYQPVKSTKRSKFPLVWAHSPSLDVIRHVAASDAIWESFSGASEKILQAGIACGHDSVQERRGKTRLSDLWRKGADMHVELPRRSAERPPPLPMGAGFGDSEQNRKVEQAAIRVVSGRYRKEGWQVASVEAQRCGFDLLCRRDGKEAHIEVKGTTGSERRCIVTAAELRHAKDDDHFVLALVTNALSESPTLEQWPARAFRDEFDFEPIQYWATATAKKVTASPNQGPQPTRRKTRAADA